MANTGNTLLALITGAAIGAGIGLLYAPESGEETRKNFGKMLRMLRIVSIRNTRKLLPI